MWWSIFFIYFLQYIHEGREWIEKHQKILMRQIASFLLIYFMTATSMHELDTGTPVRVVTSQNGEQTLTVSDVILSRGNKTVEESFKQPNSNATLLKRTSANVSYENADTSRLREHAITSDDVNDVNISSHQIINNSEYVNANISRGGSSSSLQRQITNRTVRGDVKNYDTDSISSGTGLFFLLTGLIVNAILYMHVHYRI